jgi:signal transduction histidine kinase
MPRSRQVDAETHDDSSSVAQRVALAVAVAATLAALALAALALVRGQQTESSGLLAWAVPAIVMFVAAGAVWTAWRQRGLATALHDARAELHALHDSSAAWQWHSDGAHRLTKWRPPANAADTHWTASSALGEPVWSYFGADAAVAAVVRARMESGAPLDGQRVCRVDGDGTHHLFELRGAALTDTLGRRCGYVGTAWPVGDDADRENAQSVLDALLLAIPVPVFDMTGLPDAPTRVLRGNAAAARGLGMPSAQLAGLAFSELLTRLPQELRATVTNALNAGDDSVGASIDSGWNAHARRIDGVLPSAGGGPCRWVLTLVPAARFEATQDASTGEHESFSYTVSHDLRAPIRVVEGFTKILKEDYGRQLDRIGNDHLDRVLGAAARMNSMIDALLALSQLTSRPLSRQPVNLSQVASFVVDELRRQSPERNVAVQIEPGMLSQGDPTLLRMVLDNLLGNAWKYTAKKRDAKIWLERGVHNGQPMFTVRDNGAGFDMRFADRLFGVFQRLHSANDFPGTGVGLASVRRIVGRHGGEVWAESAVDRGSSFHFTLPESHPKS